MAKLSEITIALIHELEQVPVDQTVTYQYLSYKTGWDKHRKPHLLQSAIKCLQSRGIFFKNVSGCGYKRLETNHSVSHVRSYHGKKLTRDTQRFGNKIMAFPPGVLSPHAQSEWEMSIQEYNARLVLERDLSEKEKRENRQRSVRILETEKSLLNKKAQTSMIDYLKAHSFG